MTIGVNRVSCWHMLVCYKLYRTPQLPLSSIPEHQLAHIINPHLQMSSYAHIDPMNPQYGIRTNRRRLNSIIPMIFIKLMLQCKGLLGCRGWYRGIVRWFKRRCLLVLGIWRITRLIRMRIRQGCVFPSVCRFGCLACYWRCLSFWTFLIGRVGGI